MDDAITLAIDLDGIIVKRPGATSYFVVPPVDERDDETADVAINLLMWAEMEREK